MGADSSKENSRNNSPQNSNSRNQRSNQYRQEAVTVAANYHPNNHQPPPQPEAQAPVERSRKPYSYTTEDLQNPVYKQANQTSLERSRQPYNYSTQELQSGIKQPMYPNVNSNNHNTVTDNTKFLERAREPYSYTTEKLQNPLLQANPPNTSQQTQNYNYNTQQWQNLFKPVQPMYPNLHPFSQDEGYVYVNYEEHRSHPLPSAPPAAVVNVPLENRSARPTVYSAQSTTSPYAPGPSRTANDTPKKNRPRSAARSRTNNDALNCPTCSQRLGLTIFQCTSGHSSCSDCRLANKSCGTCRSPISGVRNIMLEAYIAELKTPCRNQGCTLRFSTDEMQRHLKQCPFGELDCPMGTYFGKCSVKCKVADMASHFDACHKEQRAAEIDKEMYIFNICSETHKMYLIKNGPFNFLVHVKVGEQDRKISMTVQLLGTKISASKWTYEFHVYNKRQPLRKYLYVDNCQSIGTPVDDIFNDNQSAILPLTYAMTFVSESALTYKFYIKKKINCARKGPKNKNEN